MKLWAATVVLAFSALCVTPAGATTPPWSDGFETYQSGAFGGGDWYGNSGYIEVRTSGLPHSGAKHIRLNAGGFGDYGVNPLDGMVGYIQDWTAGVAANVTFVAAGDASVVTLTGWGKITGVNTTTREVALSYELFNQAGGTLSKLFMTSDGTVQALSVYAYDYEQHLAFVDASVPAKIATPSIWSKFAMKVDFSNGLVRFEHNDAFVHLSGSAASSLGGFICDTAAMRKIPASNSSQPMLYFDDVSVANSVHCAGDLNLDGLVDDQDFVRFAPQYDVLDCANAPAPMYCSADLNRDGIVDDGDFVQFVGTYQNLLCP